jgi:hypothetical protein
MPLALFLKIIFLKKTVSGTKTTGSHTFLRDRLGAIATLTHTLGLFQIKIVRKHNAPF